MKKARQFRHCCFTQHCWRRCTKPDGYIYVYGVRGGNKELLVARVKDDQFEDFHNGAIGMAAAGMLI